MIEVKTANGKRY